MAHREHTGDIWRRDNNRVGRFGGLQIGRKTALLEPTPIPLLLDGTWLVGGGDLATHGKPNLLSRPRMRNLEGWACRALGSRVVNQNVSSNKCSWDLRRVTHTPYKAAKLARNDVAPELQSTCIRK